MKKFLFLSLLLLDFACLKGQLRFSEGQILIQNKHLWRGNQLGRGVSFEPSITFGAGNFSLNLWGAVTPNNSYSELDIVPSYAFKHFTITLFDYYNPVHGEENHFLSFKEGASRHSVELTFDNHAATRSKIKWMIGTFLFGDKNKESGKPFYSTYAELRFPFRILSVKVEPFAGITPFKGYYADRFACINSGVKFSREFDLNLPFKFPLSMSFVANPYKKTQFVNLSGGISF
jgi:hypothetical protein